MLPLNVGPGYWNPPPDVIEAGRSARVTYTDGPRASDVDPQYRTLLRTQLPIAPGTQVLRDKIVREHNVSQTYMPGRARFMRDDDKLDLHQSGRAIDAMSMSDHAKGEEIANDMVRNAERYGVQFVVFAGNRWSAGQPAARRWAGYEGSASHNDHPHIELSAEGAAMHGSWWAQQPRPTTAQTNAATKGASAPYFDHGSFVDDYGPYLAGGALLMIGLGALFYFAQ